MPNKLKSSGGRGPLTGRDIAALDFAYAQVVATILGKCIQGQPFLPSDLDPDDINARAFKLADGFVKHSRGSWAEKERQQALRDSE